jgi:PPOX class probable F420-dependent enzyme
VFTTTVFADWELELIGRSRRAALATIGAAGRPNLVPVCFAFAAGRFAVPIDEKPKSGRPLARLRNIDRDPRVSLLFDHYDDDWRQLAWLRVEGVASLESEGGPFRRELDELRRRYAQYREMALESRPLILIEPTRAVSWRWDAAPTA